MKDLQEMLYFVTSEIKGNAHYFEKIEGDQTDHKLFRLICMMRKKEFESDEQAVESLYGKEPVSAKFRMLKSRLKDRLINMIFLNDSNLSFKNPYNRFHYQIERNIVAAQLLILKDKRALAVSLLKPALHTALHFQFTHAVISACRLLCYHFAYNGNAKELRYYGHIYRKQHRLFQKEIEIENLYNELLLRNSQSAGYDRQTLTLLKKNYEAAGKICKNYKSHIIRLYYFRIAVSYYHSRNRFNYVIKLSRQFTIYLEKHPHLLQNARAGEFAMREMESCMRLQHFNESKTCVQRCLKYFTPYSTPWLQFHEYYFLIAMRTGNTSHALHIHQMITSSGKFNKLPELQKERWRIHEAFLNFALPDELPKKNFNLFRFLNEVPLANRDKSGYNFSIFLAQIILLINIRDTDRLIDLEKSFREYLRRYIKKDIHPRHYIFGKMIRCFLNNNFKIQGIERTTNQLLKILHTKKGKYGALEEIEVIPYDMLWKMLLEKAKLIEVQV